MRTETHTQEWYLHKPECRKWIRQCSSCGTYGRDPQRPPGTLGYAFDDMFHLMVLDDLGRCEQCIAANRRLMDTLKTHREENPTA